MGGVRIVGPGKTRISLSAMHRQARLGIQWCVLYEISRTDVSINAFCSEIDIQSTRYLEIEGTL